jgi:hypothetical protein
VCYQDLALPHGTCFCLLQESYRGKNSWGIAFRGNFGGRDRSLMELAVQHTISCICRVPLRTKRVILSMTPHTLFYSFPHVSRERWENIACSFVFNLQLFTKYLPKTPARHGEQVAGTSASASDQHRGTLPGGANRTPSNWS